MPMPAHLRLIEEGMLDGMRLDHVDGLLDPKGYFDDLRAAAPRPFYLVVEKILAAARELREDWPVEGTTGYEFANLVLGSGRPGGEEGFTRDLSRLHRHAPRRSRRSCATARSASW